MAKNPLLEKKFTEGYSQGFKSGKDVGIATAVEFIATKFAVLPEVKGIGPKTLEKIRNAVGEEYFKS
ncbi:hypothetical protein ABE096_14120 [Robertmurraya massiliosenegalensis]|uniref:hypothetical protein n=1 Tax=Robertmurraya TaxID=2837507 RepID=UPI0039A585A2